MNPYVIIGSLVVGFAGGVAARPALAKAWGWVVGKEQKVARVLSVVKADAEKTIDDVKKL